VIFVDTNVISETGRRNPDRAVLDWLFRHDRELALSTVVLAEIAFGIERLWPDQRATRLGSNLSRWRSRFAWQMFAFTEQAALDYAAIMGEAVRHGRPISAPDGMIAAIARINGGRLATRNIKDFHDRGIELIDPWSA
jgi:predicted nucleic acid-binding protein